VSLITISLIALGGALAIEGALWAVIPSKMRELYEDSFRMGDRMLHSAGLLSVAIGMILIVLGAKLSGL